MASDIWPVRMSSGGNRPGLILLFPCLSMAEEPKHALLSVFWSTLSAFLCTMIFHMFLELVNLSLRDSQIFLYVPKLLPQG